MPDDFRWVPKISGGIGNPILYTLFKLREGMLLSLSYEASVILVSKSGKDNTNRRNWQNLMDKMDAVWFPKCPAIESRSIPALSFW